MENNSATPKSYWVGDYFWKILPLSWCQVEISFWSWI